MVMHFLILISCLNSFSFLMFSLVCIEIRKHPESPGRQVDLFLSALKSKNEPGTLKAFLDAVYKSKETKFISIV